MNLHKHQLYLLKQHNESFNSWSAIIVINTEGKSLNMKLGLGLSVCYNQWSILTVLYVGCYQSVTRNSNNISGYVYKYNIRVHNHPAYTN